MNMKRLAFALFTYFPYGGLQRDMLAIAEKCRDCGCQITVFTMSWEGPKPEGIEVVELGHRGLSNSAQVKRFIKSFTRRIEQEDFDGVVGFNKLPGLDIYFAADTCYYKKAVEQRGPLYRLTPRFNNFYQAERSVLAPDAKTQILALTPQQKKDFCHYHGTPESRIQTLPPAAAPDFGRPPNWLDLRRETRKRLGLADHHLMILQVGSNFKTKGLDRAIKALAALPKQWLDKTRLYSIGRGKTNEYRRLATSLKVDDKVVFLGEQQAVETYFFSADLLLQPSIQESAGIVLIEALTAGLPVICTAACGYAYHIQNAGAGRVVNEPFHQEELNHALLTIIEQAPLTHFSANALAYAEQLADHDLHNEACSFICHNISGTPYYRQRRSQQYLDDHLKAHWQNKDPFAEIDQLSGKTVRSVKNRRTFKTTIAGQSYYVKLHTGIGWRELFKNLTTLKIPVWGADNEYAAISRLENLNIPTMTIGGFATKGRLPTNRKSFIITRDLGDLLTVEDVVQDKQNLPLPFAIKTGLLKNIAHAARLMHNSGMNHRDFYICHFLLDQTDRNRPRPLTKDHLKLFLIDLHRAQIRTKTPFRWRVKDLAGIWFSAMDAELNQKDLLRFIKAYANCPLRESLENNRRFWSKVRKQARRLYVKQHGRPPPPGQ